MNATLPNIEKYHRDGILFPFQVLDAERLSMYRRKYEELEAFHQGRPSASQLKQLHLFYPWAYDLVLNPAILRAVEKIIGPDILVHSSSIFCKQPKDDFFVSWHQDGHYIDLDQSKLVSAWVALSDSHSANGCLRVMPGTHQRKYKHTEIKNANNMLSSGLTLAEQLDESQAVNVQLQAGEMSLHHVDIIHGSNANQSDEKRIGFAIRYMAPEVKQGLVHYDVVLAQGEDRYGYYDLMEQRPKEKNLAEGTAEQTLFFKNYLKRRAIFFDQKK